ncbi:hypothetical protein CY34DRAFT_601789 [Suillus luteus UH-Slu-Lm8-n1]|uniref:Uncharacterized protein n=1 Tax=Suillus luteus UH-Slu-Lm8-n1 TaxID=930992 RepID=A0A0D0BN92_9AGAM|nr:hypothetical protein CY34DRAFT_601789 [Suillus luteus UH-Slu-Lm8-n1]
MTRCSGTLSVLPCTLSTNVKGSLLRRTKMASDAPVHFWSKCTGVVIHAEVQWFNRRRDCTVV